MTLELFGMLVFGIIIGVVFGGLIIRAITSQGNTTTNSISKPIQRRAFYSIQKKMPWEEDWQVQIAEGKVVDYAGALVKIKFDDYAMQVKFGEWFTINNPNLRFDPPFAGELNEKDSSNEGTY